MTDDTINLPGSELPEKWRREAREAGEARETDDRDDFKLIYTAMSSTRARLAEEVDEAIDADKCGECTEGYVPRMPDGEPEPCPDCYGFGSKALAAAYEAGRRAEREEWERNQ